MPWPRSSPTAHLGDGETFGFVAAIYVPDWAGRETPERDAS